MFELWTIIIFLTWTSFAIILLWSIILHWRVSQELLRDKPEILDVISPLPGASKNRIISNKFNPEYIYAKRFIVTIYMKNRKDELVNSYPEFVLHSKLRKWCLILMGIFFFMITVVPFIFFAIALVYDNLCS